MLSDSSSDSALFGVNSSSGLECLKEEMWGRSKIPSSSMLMMGISRLHRESGKAKKQKVNKDKTIIINL